MQEILLNVLIFCGILLLIALIVGAVLAVLTVIDIRRASKKVTKQVEAVTSIIDIGSLLLGGMEGAKKRLSPSKANIVALVAGLKKGLQVLLGKDKGGE